MVHLQHKERSSAPRGGGTAGFAFRFLDEDQHVGVQRASV